MMLSRCSREFQLTIKNSWHLLIISLQPLCLPLNFKETFGLAFASPNLSHNRTKISKYFTMNLLLYSVSMYIHKTVGNFVSLRHKMSQVEKFKTVRHSKKYSRYNIFLNIRSLTMIQLPLESKCSYLQIRIFHFEVSEICEK